jgi:hypothetical protein
MPKSRTILLLLVCLSLGFSFVFPLFDRRWTAEATFFGINTTSTSVYSAGNNTIVGSAFVAGTNGNVTSMTVYGKKNAGTSINLSVGLYQWVADNNAGNLLGSTYETIVTSTSLAWYTLNVKANIPIVAGTKYFILAYVGNGTGASPVFNCYRSQPSGWKTCVYKTSAGTYPTFPSPLTGESTNDFQFSMYATYTEDVTSIPSSSVDAITPYWCVVAKTITATATDGAGSNNVKNVSLWYRYSSDNASWGGYKNFGLDTASPWSWSFTFSNGTGYYQFYSIAKDYDGNSESAPGSADRIGGYDNAVPTSSLTAISPYIRITTPITINATASDTGPSGLKSVSLYYAYSKDNTTFSNDILVSTDTVLPWSWSFSPSKQNYYYKFYSIAIDNATNTEAFSAYDTQCYYKVRKIWTDIQKYFPYREWTKETPITITNGVAGYQIRLNVTYDADMNANFSDLRFIDNDFLTVIPYWIEYKVDSSYAIVWLKLYDTGNTIYMIYGKSGAVPASNGTNTWNYYLDWLTDKTGLFTYKMTGNLYLAEWLFTESSFTSGAGYRFMHYTATTTRSINNYGVGLLFALQDAGDKTPPDCSNFIATFENIDTDYTPIDGITCIYYRKLGTSYTSGDFYILPKIDKYQTWSLLVTSSKMTQRINNGTSLDTLLNSTNVTTNIPTVSLQFLDYGSACGSADPSYNNFWLYDGANKAIQWGAYNGGRSTLKMKNKWVAIGKYQATEPTSSIGAEGSVSSLTGYNLTNWNTFASLILTSWKNVSKGYNTFGNSATWETEVDGWNTFENSSSWEKENEGWNTFENVASWLDEATGWNTFSNAAIWTTEHDGWNSFRNTSEWEYVITSPHNIYGETECGYIQNAVPSNNYLQEWAEDVGFYMTGGSSQRIGQRLNTNYYIYRGCLFFDTSLLPLDRITSVSLVFRIGAKVVSAGHDFDLVIQDGQPSHPAPVDADYDKDLYIGNYGSINTTSFNVGDWVSIQFDASLLNTSGTTKLMVRSSRDITGTAVAGPSPTNEYIIYDTAGIGDEPYLIVYYAPIGWNTFGNVSSWIQYDQGWNTFGNTANWATEVDGWNTFGNSAGWNTEHQGWNTFRNVSSWVQYDQGWNTFGNISAWDLIEDGWNTFNNTPHWGNIKQGWNTFGNINHCPVVTVLHPTDGSTIYYNMPLPNSTGNGTLYFNASIFDQEADWMNASLWTNYSGSWVCIWYDWNTTNITISIPLAVNYTPTIIYWSINTTEIINSTCGWDNETYHVHLEPRSGGGGWAYTVATTSTGFVLTLIGLSWGMLFLSWLLWRQKFMCVVLAITSMMLFFASAGGLVYITQGYAVYDETTGLVVTGEMHLASYQSYSMVFVFFGLVAMAWLFVRLFDWIMEAIIRKGILIR